MLSNPELNIVVVYETFPNAIQAREMSERLAGELQLDGEIDCDFWNFELLNNAYLRGQAAAEASDAGMIIIATSAAGELPPQVLTWINSWPRHPREDLAALVVLMDLPGEIEDTPPVCEFLRQIASERGMDFFCKAGEWWQFDLEPVKANRRAENPLVGPEGHGYREHIGSGWGIND
jgi:hypothetical protein